MKHENSQAQGTDVIEVQVTDAMPVCAPPTSLVSHSNPYLPMIDRFLQGGGDIEKLDKLLDLKERWDRSEAEKAYNAAKAEFKANPPDVYKDKVNKQYDSKYTSIGNMVNTVSAALSPHGLSASWDIDQTDPKNIKVTCILAHTMGHRESVSMSGPPDETGQKNALQKIKSTITYLKLATFEAITGVASKEGNLDDDGAAASSDNTEENMAKVADFESAFVACIDELELGKIGAQIAQSGLPPRLRTRLRKAFTSRMNELRASSKGRGTPGEGGAIGEAGKDYVFGRSS